MNVMDQRITKQIIDLQKATFDNAFSAMAMLQDQAEKTTNMLLESSLWPVPEEGKRIMKEWVQAFKKGREEFKKTLDESFNKMQDFVVREEAKMKEEGAESREEPRTRPRPRSEETRAQNRR